MNESAKPAPILSEVFGAICEEEKGVGGGRRGGSKVRDDGVEGVFGLESKGNFIKIVDIKI